jgi:hypothetical protein
MRITPPQSRKISIARAIGVQNDCPTSDTKDLHKVTCGGLLYLTKRPLSNPTVVQAQSGIASKLDKKAGKSGFFHHLRVVGEPAENSTSLFG